MQSCLTQLMMQASLRNAPAAQATAAAALTAFGFRSSTTHSVTTSLYQSFHTSLSNKVGGGNTGPGPGPRTRSMEQAAASGETSTTSGPESQPGRSPDAPADPADLAGNRGSDPDKVIRTAAWQADQTMAGSYQNHPGPDTGGSFIDHAASMAGRLAEKVSGAAGVAAQAASGAVSAMSQTAKAASGASSGVHSGHPHSPLSRGSPSDPKDQNPLSDDMTVGEVKSSMRDSRHEWDQQVANTNSDTAASGELDTAGGTSDPEMLQRKTEQGGYTQAADRLMDIEGLPKDSGKA